MLLELIKIHVNLVKKFANVLQTSKYVAIKYSIQKLQENGTLNIQRQHVQRSHAKKTAAS